MSMQCGSREQPRAVYNFLKFLSVHDEAGSERGFFLTHLAVCLRVEEVRKIDCICAEKPEKKVVISLFLL